MSPADGAGARRLRGRVVSNQGLRVTCTCGQTYDTEQEAVDEDWAKCPSPQCRKPTSVLLRELASSPSADS